MNETLVNLGLDVEQHRFNMTAKSMTQNNAYVLMVLIGVQEFRI